MTVRPTRPFAEIIKENAKALGMHRSDYVVYLAAHALGREEFAPEPSKTLETLAGLDIDAAPLPSSRAPELAHIQDIPVTAKELRHKIAS